MRIKCHKRYYCSLSGCQGQNNILSVSLPLPIQFSDASSKPIRNFIASLTLFEVTWWVTQRQRTKVQNCASKTSCACMFSTVYNYPTTLNFIGPLYKRAIFAPKGGTQLEWVEFAIEFNAGDCSRQFSLLECNAHGFLTWISLQTDGKMHLNYGRNTLIMRISQKSMQNTYLSKEQ